MKLNLEFWKSEEDKITKTEQEIIEYITDKTTQGKTNIPASLLKVTIASIIEYINKYEKKEFDKIIEEDGRLEIILALSKLRENIVSWYPFKKQCKILEIGGGFGEITGILCDNASRVVTLEESKIKAETMAKRHKDRNNLEIIVGNLENIKLEEKFDYIVIMGIKNNNIISKAIELLNNEGIILTAFDNKFGVNQLATIKANGENLINKKELQTLASFEKHLENLGLDRKTYFVLTDYKLTNVIFSEKFEMTQENMSRNITYYEPNDIKIFNQNDIYRKILEEKNIDILKNFSNSFFIEIFKENYIENGIKFVSFSNMRKKQYRIKTIIYDKQVIKSNMITKSREHIELIKSNIDYMNKYGIKTLDTYDKDEIKNEFQEEETLDNVIIEKMKQGKLQEGIELIIKFKEMLMSKIKISSAIENNAFDKYGIPYTKEDIEKMHFAEKGLLDLIFQNCFYINNEFYFYDQEWMEERLPIEFIIYRSIIYFNGIREFFTNEELLEKVGISNKQADLFKILDDKIQEKIRNNIMWNLTRAGTSIKDTHIQMLTLQHQVNLLNLEINKIKEENQNIKNESEKIKKENQEIKEELEQIKQKENEKSNQKISKIMEFIKNKK